MALIEYSQNGTVWSEETFFNIDRDIEAVILQKPDYLYTIFYELVAYVKVVEDYQ